MGAAEGRDPGHSTVRTERRGRGEELLLRLCVVARAAGEGPCVRVVGCGDVSRTRWAGAVLQGSEGTCPQPMTKRMPV